MGISILIATDLEGISGVYTNEAVADTASPTYINTLERLMLNVNAAVAGAFDGGAEQVYVNDGHSSGKNFIEGKLDERAVQIRRYTDCDLHTIDAMFHIGAHAMAGTLNAFLDHTQSSVAWHDYYINGRRCGEIAQEGVFAAAYGIPYVMMSGDEAACLEAKQFYGNIECVTVKYAIGRNKAKSAFKDDADADLVELAIREAASRSIALIGRIKPIKTIMPMEVRLEYNRADYCDAAAYNAAANNSAVERLDARTLRKLVCEIKDFEDLIL
jgi:D-amino peptidase